MVEHRLYKITADYRPNNPNKPVYYVIATSKSEAKKKFSDRISWLKIYDVVEYIGDSTEILAHPDKHIIIR